jgi:hypothetical protein
MSNNDHPAGEDEERDPGAVEAVGGQVATPCELYPGQEQAYFG